MQRCGVLVYLRATTKMSTLGSKCYNWHRNVIHKYDRRTYINHRMLASLRDARGCYHNIGSISRCAFAPGTDKDFARWRVAFKGVWSRNDNQQSIWLSLAKEPPVSRLQPNERRLLIFHKWGPWSRRISEETCFYGLKCGNPSSWWIHFRRRDNV